jgi:hypothetical protein
MYIMNLDEIYGHNPENALGGLENFDVDVANFEY